MTSLVFNRYVPLMLSLSVVACSEPGGISASAVSTTPPAMSAAGATAGSAGNKASAGAVASSATAGTTAPASGSATAGTTTGMTSGSVTGSTAGSPSSSGSAGAPTSAGSAGVSASSGSAGAMAAAGSGGGGAVTFKMVFDNIIVETGCASGAACHLGMAAGKLTMVDQDATYTSLVGTMAMGTSMMGNCADAGIVRVKAGDPDNSLLMQKLQGTQKCGMAMPPGGKLTDAQQKLVHDWIQMGAMK
jgi:hypothetical protein